MLALVHPYNPSPDVGHRAASASSASSRPRQQARKSSLPLPSSSTFSSSSRTTTLSQQPQPQPPPLHRYATAPQQPTATTTAQLPRHTPQPPPRQPSPPPPKTQRPSTPTTPAPATPPHHTPAVDIQAYPSSELLKLLASLLAQIAATNDKLDAGTSPHPSEPPSTTPTRTSLSSVMEHDAPIWRTLTTASRTAISTPSSTLTFHARNIPTISLEAYLLRILKYCPTTNEVFLSLLVYFDRMSKLSTEATGRTFVIDSYNIHRLVIAGVTVASKFFSDVFYTNSRYAKVGGLPLAELNQLELQFLLLNDFCLVISSAEMQRYAEQLILFSNSTESPLTPSTPSTPLLGNAASAGPSHAHPTSSSAPGGPSASIQGIPGGAEPPSRQPQHHYLQPGSNGHDHTRPSYNGPTGSSSSSGSSSSATVSGSSYYKRTPNAFQQYNGGDDTETETETETEAGETDGGSTTDDEPTIRPTHSSAGSDTRSLCGSINSNSGAEDTGDEGGDEDTDGGFGDDEQEEDGMDMEEQFSSEGQGDRTPERLARGRDTMEGERTPERAFLSGRIRDGSRGRDHAMSSP